MRAFQNPVPNFVFILMYSFAPRHLQQSLQPLFPGFVTATRKRRFRYDMSSYHMMIWAGGKEQQILCPWDLLFCWHPERTSVPTILSHSTSTPLTQQSALFVIPENPGRLPAVRSSVRPHWKKNDRSTIYWLCHMRHIYLTCQFSPLLKWQQKKSLSGCCVMQGKCLSQGDALYMLSKR